MRSSVARWVALHLAIVTGLATSTLMLVDYLRRNPALCAEGGGCAAVRETALAHPLGIPTPAFGVLAFALLGALALVRRPLARTLLLRFSTVVGVVGLALLIVQARMEVFCPYCVVVDVSAFLVAMTAMFATRVPEASLPPGWGGAVLAVAFGAPLGIAIFMRPSVPKVIAEELAHAPKDEALLIDFVDFECPFCRETNERLVPLLEARASKVHVVRKQVPLRMHPHAMDAARAACCGETLGKGDAMANALFSAPEDELTPLGCERIAESVGLGLTPYRACIADPKTDERIRADRETFDKAAVKGVDGLPLMWIGDAKLMGAQDRDTLAHALDDAIARAGS